MLLFYVQMVSLTPNTPHMSNNHLKICHRLDFKNAKNSDFRNFKQLLVKTFCFQGKQRPETCTEEFVESKQLTVVQTFFLC